MASSRNLSRWPGRALVLGAFVFTGFAGSPDPAEAQLAQRNEQFYYPGSFNWQFLKRYPEAARLFNAFDYGHAVLYETLYTAPDLERADKLEREYQYLTTDLLVRPPRFAIVEEVVEPSYAKLAWRAKMMFDWAHILHRQIYDIYADPGLSPARRDSLIERVTDYYLTKSDYAFLPVPKSMALMDEQYYSKAFREAHPKFNGLIWAYHWLQVGLYEPFIEGRSPAETKAGVQATVARFWSMLEDAPNRLPAVMPMTSAVAPNFSAAHPRAAIIFDNLHMMHDIISDILQSDTVPSARKGETIELALDEFQDSTRNVITMEMWRDMADHMGGVGAMGGPATGIIRPIMAQAPVAGDDNAAGHAAHGVPLDSASLGAPAAVDRPGATVGDSSPEMQHRKMMELHRRMMQDTVIRQRIMADTTMHRMMMEMVPGTVHRHDPEPERGARPAPLPRAEPARPAPVRRPRPARPAAPPRPKPDSTPAHDGHHPPSGG
jgi:hypothetical protein